MESHACFVLNLNVNISLVVTQIIFGNIYISFKIFLVTNIF